MEEYTFQLQNEKLLDIQQLLYRTKARFGFFSATASEIRNWPTLLLEPEKSYLSPPLLSVMFVSQDTGGNILELPASWPDKENLSDVGKRFYEDMRQRGMQKPFLKEHHLVKAAISEAALHYVRIRRKEQWLIKVNEDKSQDGQIEFRALNVEKLQTHRKDEYRLNDHLFTELDKKYGDRAFIIGYPQFSLKKKVVGINVVLLDQCYELTHENFQKHVYQQYFLFGDITRFISIDAQLRRQISDREKDFMHSIGGALSELRKYKKKCKEDGDTDNELYRSISFILEEYHYAKHPDEVFKSLASVDISALLDKDVKFSDKSVEYRKKVFNITIDKQFDKNLPKAMIHKRKFLEVINIIFKNAVDELESQDGGTISVKTSFSTEENCVIIEISDSGRGIPEDLRETISCLPVKSTKTEGLGWGLYKARRIIEKMNGGFDIQISDRGTTITIKLKTEENHGKDFNHR